MESKSLASSMWSMISVRLGSDIKIAAPDLVA